LQTMAFFDRGIPDVIAYIKIAGLPVPPHYPEQITQHPYHRQVFILPPWEEIYVNDNERWQDFGESALIYQAIRETYIAYGYELIEVPKASLEERIAFVLGFITLS
jgi:predicted ATPase